MAGFFGARLLSAQEARHDSEKQAAVAAAQIRERIDEGASLAESLRRFVATGVTSDGFASTASRWLSPAGFPAAAWVQPVPASRRATYERQSGHPIVTFDRQLRVVPVGPRPSYLPMVLVSGIPPTAVPGLDLGGEPGMATALTRARTFDDTRATPMTTLQDGTTGLFLITFAPRLVGSDLRPGFVAIFVSAPDLAAAATDVTPVRLTAGGTSVGELGGASPVRSAFTEAGQRFDVAVPLGSVGGAAAVPWIVLAVGLVLAALAGAIGVIAGRRAKAKAEVDRLFTLSPELMTVLTFDGHWRRLNPAFETLLGYTEREALGRAAMEFVYPDDRERTEAEWVRLVKGTMVVAFENRMIGKTGPYRWIEWTATSAPGEALIYAMGRDVTERRRAETELERLAGEQAALRRVATLVAREASQTEVFAAIAQEIGGLVGADEMRVLRYDDDSAVVVANSGEHGVIPIGSRYPLDIDHAASRVLRTGRPARIDDYRQLNGPFAETASSLGIRSGVGAPISVEGRLWGAMVAVTTHAEPLPPETESRLGQFTELMATAIANSEARAEVERLAEEQAALRRVATLVAHGGSPTAVFGAVAAELEGLLEADAVTVIRYEPGGESTLLAHHGWGTSRVPTGTRVRPATESVSATVRRTERPARVDYYDRPDGPVAQLVETLGVRAAVGAPIVVDGGPWGVAVATWRDEESPPAGTEERMAQFAELLETAIANADSRDQLTASRARLVTEGDEARRHVVRDLHDGAQQRLVHTIITLKLAQQAFREADRTAEALVGEALAHAERSNAELRELAHGILPAALRQGGLRAGVRAVVRRLDVRTDVDVPDERFPSEVEASAYFVVAEALTNVVKHSHASNASVRAFVETGMLHVEVRDNGIGGANPGGHGLVGMRDRVNALGGRLKIESPVGGPTAVIATLPL